MLEKFGALYQSFDITYPECVLAHSSDHHNLASRRPITVDCVCYGYCRYGDNLQSNQAEANNHNCGPWPLVLHAYCGYLEATENQHTDRRG